MALAMRTGIAAAAWRDGDPRDLDTALDLLAEQERNERR